MTAVETFWAVMMLRLPRKTIIMYPNEEAAKAAMKRLAACAEALEKLEKAK